MKEIVKMFYKKAKEFLRKNWWDVRYLLLLIVAFLFFRFEKFVKWLVQDTGSVADWVSGLGTIAAFGAVIWQQHRQERIARALRVEQARPRFTRMIRGKLPDKTDILTNKKIEKKLLYEILQEPRQNISKIRSELLTLENISENTIYCLEILIIYEDNSEQFWAQNGIHKNGVIALVPSFLDGGMEPSKETKDRVKLIVRFLTPLNETGFYIYDYEKKEERYLFVKDPYNDLVRSSKQGEMLDNDDDYIEKLNKKFDGQKGRIFITVPYQLLKNSLRK